MSVSDPIADMLTRIRNALAAGKDQVVIPHSKLKSEIARLLKQEGYVVDFASEGATKKLLRVFLKYDRAHKPVIKGLKRVSRPGLRDYVASKDIQRVLNGLGTSIISTSAGLMTDQEARTRKLGGEVLCEVW